MTFSFIKECECGAKINKKWDFCWNCNLEKKRERYFRQKEEEAKIVSCDCLICYESLDTGHSNDKFIIQNSWTGCSSQVTKKEYEAHTENKKMNEQKEIRKISWDEATKNDFLVFEEGKRKAIAITKWYLTEEEVNKFGKEDETEIKAVFHADVVGIDGAIEKAKIRSQSARFIKAVKPFLEKENNDKVIFLSIKKIGKDQATNYDVEAASPFEV